MKLKFALSALLSTILLPAISFGQDVEMADGLRANGKIYIVIIVLAVILAGLFIFLMSIDSRLRKLEKNSGK